MQHKNINMNRYYWNFPRHPIASVKFKMIGINTILCNFHYRVDPELDVGVCAIHWITCACPVCVAQIVKYWLPTFSP